MFDLKPDVPPEYVYLLSIIIINNAFESASQADSGCHVRVRQALRECN